MGSQQAGAFLRRILTEPGPARRAWVARAGGRGLDDINLAAVCQVVAEHLWENGLRNEADTDLPRRLKDRVRRAVQGTFLTAETVEWFSGAFGFTKSDHRQLLALLADTPSSRSVVGAVSPSGIKLPRRRHRTVSLTEHHYVGADRCPSHHRTTQVLEATEDAVASYPYMFDTDTIDVEVIQGGRVTGPVRLVGPDLFGVDITLTRPLLKGETTTVTYESTFSYAELPTPSSGARPSGASSPLTSGSRSTAMPCRPPSISPNGQHLRPASRAFASRSPLNQTGPSTGSSGRSRAASWDFAGIGRDPAGHDRLRPRRETTYNHGEPYARGHTRLAPGRPLK
jgi:hypothetical protein